MKRKFQMTLVLVILVSLVLPTVSRGWEGNGKKPLPINWSDGQTVRFHFVALENIIKTDADLRLRNYNGTVTVKDGYTSALPLGNNGLVAYEYYGNIDFFLHSGYGPDHRPMPAEAIRSYLEGGSRAQPNARNTPEVTAARIASLMGSDVYVTQGNKIVHMVIANVIKVPHEQLDDYDSDVNAILPKLVNLEMDTQGTDTFQEAMFSPDQYIFYTFCGWAQTTDHYQWYDDHKWIILLKIVSEAPQ